MSAGRAATDIVIVGAGTSGCVLAARLSEDPLRRVTLLEAGPDHPSAAEVPAPLRDSYALPLSGWDWGLQARSGGDRHVGFPVGKVVGGTSAINAAGAWRPLASDFDAWAARGLPEWRWPEVLDAFNAVEADQEFGDRPWHGRDGPVPVTRWGWDELRPVMGGWVEALERAGHPRCEDMNAPDAVGVGLNPQSRRGRDRVSAADAYLRPARGRPNLTVLGDTTVERVVLEGDRAVGVVAGGRELRARTVVLCAGVPLSPALLLASGIGPPPVLSRAGVPVRLALPGVGTRVMDQPAVVVMAVPRDAPGPDDGPFLQVAARLERFPGHEPDRSFYLCLFAGMPVPERMRPLVRSSSAHWLICGDLAPASTGTVVLGPADAGRPPICDLRFYSAAGDLPRMRAGVRAMWSAVGHEAFTAHVERFSLVTDRMFDDDDRLDAMIRARSISRQPWGGCPMGPDDDPDAVVDACCRVRGVDGLRVVDTSVVPVPLRAGGALTAMAIAERIARVIRGGG